MRNIAEDVEMLSVQDVVRAAAEDKIAWWQHRDLQPAHASTVVAAVDEALAICESINSSLASSTPPSTYMATPIHVPIHT